MVLQPKRTLMVQKPRSKRTRFGGDGVAVKVAGRVAVAAAEDDDDGGDEVMKVVERRWRRLRGDDDGGDEVAA
ncbi:hypothetical protein Tco_1260820 [Tanacetum coccineum]